MLDLYAELRRVVQALEAAGIAYGVAGGVAVSIYATPRATQDVDLLIAAGDSERAVAVLEPLGFRATRHAIRVAGGRLEIQRLIKIEGADLLPIDLLSAIDADLARAVSERTSVAWEGTSLWLVSVGGLRHLKRLRNSAQDRADLEALGPETP